MITWKRVLDYSDQDYWIHGIQIEAIEGSGSFVRISTLPSRGSHTWAVTNHERFAGRTVCVRCGLLDGGIGTEPGDQLHRCPPDLPTGWED